MNHHYRKYVLATKYLNVVKQFNSFALGKSSNLNHLEIFSSLAKLSNIQKILHKDIFNSRSEYANIHFDWSVNSVLQEKGYTYSKKSHLLVPSIWHKTSFLSNRLVYHPMKPTFSVIDHVLPSFSMFVCHINRNKMGPVISRPTGFWKRRSLLRKRKYTLQLLANSTSSIFG